MARDSAHYRKLADLSRRLAEDSTSMEAHEKLLETAKEMDRKAELLKRLEADPVE